VEGAQDAQAVLSAEQSRFYLDLVRPAATLSKAGCSVMGGALLAAFGLMLLQLPGIALIVALLGIAFAGFRWPTAKTTPVGRLLFFSDKLVVRTGSEQLTIALLPATTIIVHYQGYANERLGAKAYASGYTNYIQLNDGLKYAFVIANEATQNTLQGELRHWYLRKVRLKEYRRGSRTILLLPTPTYEQLQQLQHELGVSLYT
jgi:hypothetical protein